jgi:hypothetical protein
MTSRPRIAVAAALAAATLTTGSAAAQTLPTATMPTPGSAQAQPDGRVAASDAAPPLTVRSATLDARSLRVKVQCERGLKARVAVTGVRAYDTTSLSCRTGRAQLSFTVPAAVARKVHRSNVSLPLRVTAKGRVPVTIGLALGRARHGLAHASDYAIDWMTNAYCTPGALWGDPGSLSISVYDGEGYGAPVGSQIFFRTWTQNANGAWNVWPGFWSYRYALPGTSGSYTDSNGVYHYVGGQTPGSWLNPQTWIISPHNWIRPVIEIHVPATGKILYYNVPVRTVPRAGAGPGVAFAQPNWCGFGV